jgi:16S rRNA processing protein RimM
MIRIGKIVATHGLQGGLIMTHLAASGDWLHPDHILFLELNKDSFIPFFVRQAKAAGKGEYMVRLEDVDSVEDAKLLIGKPVHVREDILMDHVADTPLLWIGFQVVDRTKGGIGPLDDVMQTGGQWLGKIMMEGREVLVPLVEQMIIEVNIRNRFIRMDLPEGLLEVYQ